MTYNPPEVGDSGPTYADRVDETFVDLDARATTNAAAIAGNVPWVPRPADFGWAAWSNDPSSYGLTTALTAGRLRGIWVPIRSTRSITRLAVIVSTAGVTQTSAGIAAYDTNGDLIVAATAIEDHAAAATDFTTTGVKHGVVASTVVSAGFWVTAWFNGTTDPFLLRGALSEPANARAQSSSLVRSWQGPAAGATTGTAPATTGTRTEGIGIWGGVA